MIEDFRNRYTNIDNSDNKDKRDTHVGKLRLSLNFRLTLCIEII